jgi:hypothetical protein
MDLYFNPYPGAAQNREDGIQQVLNVADALYRLKHCLRGNQLFGLSVSNDLSLSEFIVIRETNAHLQVQNIFRWTENTEREKIRLLLQLFNKGRVIDSNEITDIENWTLKNIGTSAPILEFAAKQKAITLTIPTEPEWRVDIIEFEGRKEILHNLWGQEDISNLKGHCINAVNDVKKRFEIRYDAKFCDGALSLAPRYDLWEKFGIFRQMDKAKQSNYKPDNILIKIVDSTKYGMLYELRCLGDEGLRIFFVLRNSAPSRILVCGFYQKNMPISPNKAIQTASGRIKKHRDK